MDHQAINIKCIKTISVYMLYICTLYIYVSFKIIIICCMAQSVELVQYRVKKYSIASSNNLDYTVCCGWIEKSHPNFYYACTVSMLSQCFPNPSSTLPTWPKALINKTLRFGITLSRHRHLDLTFISLSYAKRYG